MNYKFELFEVSSV